ncbi:MAG: peptidoglycan editing factor PgeF [Candidatus Puniceispirillum sp.]|nr:peptidoglycan editing factor PgeF [Candidatus Pelagibacter sp.]MBA4283274.1 peptidoglycan editing factor PgeF [Candidatus Puniceispirillum sp.]
MGYLTSQILSKKSQLTQKFIHGFCDKECGMNETKIAQTLDCEGFSVVRVDQQHTNQPIWVDELRNANMAGDAIVTQTPCLLLCIKTADCIPILIYDENSNMVAAIHAGWKGLCYGIIENTVAMMIGRKANPVNMVAAIGPCIQKESFEVDQNVVNQFQGYEDYFYPQKEQQEKNQKGMVKFLGDLPQIAKMKMHALGIHNIDILNVDTYQDERFFSFRKATHQGFEEKGRQMSCIGLNQISGNSFV